MTIDQRFLIQSKRDKNFSPLQQYEANRKLMHSLRGYEASIGYFSDLESKFAATSKGDFETNNLEFAAILNQLTLKVQEISAFLKNTKSALNGDVMQMSEKLKELWEAANDIRTEKILSYSKSGEAALCSYVQALMEFTELNLAENEQIQIETSQELWEGLEPVVLNPNCPRDLIWNLVDYSKTESNFFAESDQSTPWIAYALTGNSLLGNIAAANYLDLQGANSADDEFGIWTIGGFNLFSNPSVSYEMLERIDPACLLEDGDRGSFDDFFEFESSPIIFPEQPFAKDVDSGRGHLQFALIAARAIWEIKNKGVMLEDLAKSKMKLSRTIAVYAGQFLPNPRIEPGKKDTFDLHESSIKILQDLVKSNYTPIWYF